jgi:gluconate kinase
MSVHGQTITWGMRIGKSTQDGRQPWLQRIGQWLAGRSESNKEALRMTLYRVWDSRREQFRPSHAESALEHAAERGGQSWLITVHSAAL